MIMLCMRLISKQGQIQACSAEEKVRTGRN